MKLYCLYDKIADRYSHFALAENDAAYVREMIAHRVVFPMNFDDFVPVCVCEETDLFLSDEVKRISWSAWRAPETKADLLKPLQMTSDELQSAIDRSDENDRKRQQQEASGSSDS